MSELLNSGKVGLTVFKNLAEQRKAIVDSWSDSGLLDEGYDMQGNPIRMKGIKAANVAQLLENQAAAMLNEVTLDSSAGRFDTVAFPIVRRVFSRLLANEIVSVQPLALPSGLLFYMDARVSYDGRDTSFNAIPPGIVNGTGTRDIVAPQNTANGQAGPNFADTSAYERFYNNQGFDMSFGTGFTTMGTTSSSAATAWVGGLNNMVFDLGAYFDSSKQQSTASLRFSAVTNIYYSGAAGNTLIVAAGGNILNHRILHQLQLNK